MFIKLDSDSNPNPLIGYVDFLRLCNVQDPRDFCGFVVKHDGVYVNMHLNEPTLFPQEFAVLSWHPTGRYKEPPLALPCTVSEFKNFISEAGLLGCVVDEELSQLEQRQQLRDERQFEPKAIRQFVDKMEKMGMKVSSKELANSPLPHTGVFADDQLASLDACRRSSPERHAANNNPGGVRAGFRKPHKVAPYVPGGLDSSEADKTITVRCVPMDLAPTPPNGRVIKTVNTTPGVAGKKSTSEVPKWLSVTGNYIVEVLQESKCVHGKDLFLALEKRAGTPGSPFERGSVQQPDKLYITAICTYLSVKMIQNHWPLIKSMRQQR